MPSYDANTLSERLGGTLTGRNVSVDRLTRPETLGDGAVAVVQRKADLAVLNGEGLIVVGEELEAAAHPDRITPNRIAVADTRLALALLSRLFDTRPPVAEGVHRSAVIHPSAQLGEDVHIGEGAVIRAGARIGAGTRVGAGCVLGEGVVLGEACLLHPKVTLYPGTHLGARVILQSGAVIGSDGFGYAASSRGALKIHHLGGTVLEDDVEIGANTCVDRGTLGDTHIGARSKIDNLCQIAHNVRLGSDCLITGMVGIAGSTTLGDRVVVGGAAGISDHLTLGDDVRVAARSVVTKNIPSGETWAGYPAQPYKKWVRGLYLQGKLEALWQAFKGT